MKPHSPVLEDAIPRIALLISNEDILAEIEKILRAHFTSLMLITTREKLAEFRRPLLVMTDTVDEVAKILDLPPAVGTQILIVVSEEDAESVSAAFEAGATDYLGHPFEAGEVIEKAEKYLEAFRHPA